MGPVARRWHANVGIVAAALLFVVALTGVVLTFRHQLKPPEPKADGAAAGPVLTMEGAIAAARGHAGPTLADTSIAELYLANDPEGTWCVVFADDVATEVYMAADGALLAVVVPTKGFTQWMFDLHTGEILGPAGTWLSAGLGVSLVWLIGSGVWLKVPRRWKGRVTVAAASK